MQSIPSRLIICLPSNLMIISACLLGRGGQGIKSAAHAVGTCAFLGGYFVQDQPLYGAERRGGPVNAFIRISDEPILDRGPVIDPSLVVVADDSLLEDLEVSLEAVIFVNTSKNVEHIRRYGIKNRLIASDLASMAVEILDKPLVSSAVAGVAARLLNQDFGDLEQALSLELKNIGLAEKELERNLALAKRAYHSVVPVELPQPKKKTGLPAFVELTYHGPDASTCSIVSAGNSQARHVGDWAHIKPVIDYDECTKCRICFVYCPDSAITIGKDDFPVVNYGACKGCNICYTECPVKAISLVRREEPV